MADKQPLSNLNYAKINLDLGATKEILKRLGNPEQSCKTIHVGGTNGKGSTSSMIASILQEADLKVGLYTSPHIESICERFSINNRLISPSELIKLEEEVIAAALLPSPIKLTFFEISTVIAFLYFAKSKVDFAVIEVGLGGRLDSTNVITPVATVITSIAKDHEDKLGKTLPAIGYEKAGIIKKKVPLIFNAKNSIAQQVIIDIAKEQEADCYQLKVDFDLKRLADRYNRECFSYFDDELTIEEISSATIGAHQVENGAVAIKTAMVLRKQFALSLSSDQIRSSFSKLQCKGRYEKVSKLPDITIDGAHNPAAISALISILKERRKLGDVEIIFGVMCDKNYKRMLAIIATYTEKISLYSPNEERAESLEKLESVAQNYFEYINLIENKDQLLSYILNMQPDSKVLITGSFMTVGEIMKILRNSDIIKPDK
ncbi:MAG: bifunctional folylpolyglutamate synthase/dihydrofolate synthase [Nitrospinota bacterium]